MANYHRLQENSTIRHLALHKYKKFQRDEKNDTSAQKMELSYRVQIPQVTEEQNYKQKYCFVTPKHSSNAFSYSSASNFYTTPHLAVIS